jgi:hypothetical protein
MSENPESSSSLSFVLTERNPMPERQTIARQSTGYARGSAPVLHFRKQTTLEPDDARITGTTRSLYRRLLALNLRKPVASQREAEAYMPPLTA